MVSLVASSLLDVVQPYTFLHLLCLPGFHVWSLCLVSVGIYFSVPIWVPPVPDLLCRSSVFAVNFVLCARALIVGVFSVRLHLPIWEIRPVRSRTGTHTQVSDVCLFL